MAEELIKRVCTGCGGELQKLQGNEYKCRYCGSILELREQISEESQILLTNALMNRKAMRFEEAQENYDAVLEKNPNHEEATFGAFLCEYGIVYEDDTDGETRIPTIHRLNECPVEQNAYYHKLTPHYRKIADQIESLRVAILEKTKKIEPYDVFICYKQNEGEHNPNEKDAPKILTREATWARDIYEVFTYELGLKVFYAEKSLEEKNTEYEPHIYTALRSAKLMILLAASTEHVNARWVKNEWKRYVKYIREGEEKTIRVLYDGLDMGMMPKELQKAQGIDHNKSSWMENLKKAAEEIFEKVPEIKRKELKKIEYTRREVARSQVEKRKLGTFEKTAVPATEAGQLLAAAKFMELRKFPVAISTLQMVLSANRSCSEAYYNLFLMENECAKDGEFIHSKKQVKSFANFEAALASGDKAQKERCLKLLQARIEQDPQGYLLDEYVALPGVTPAQIDKIAEAMYDAALKVKNEKLFDSAIKTVNDTDKYIHFNCEFGKAMFPKLGAGAAKYFDTVLAVDEGHQESLLYKYMIKANVRSEADFCQYCIGLNDYTELEKIYGYGYFVRLSDMLFTAATNEIRKVKATARLEKALALADFILQITPNSHNKLFIARMNNVKDALFEAEQYSYINKYIEQLLAIDPKNDYAYFERLMVKCKVNDYMGLALLGDNLVEESDFKNAMNTRLQNVAGDTFYLDVYEQFTYLIDVAKQNRVDLKGFVDEVGSQGLPTLESFVASNARTKIQSLVKNYHEKVLTRDRQRRQAEAARRTEERNRQLAAEQARIAREAREAEERTMKGKHSLAWILNIGQLLIYILLAVFLNKDAQAVLGGEKLIEDSWLLNEWIHNQAEGNAGAIFLILPIGLDILVNVLFFTQCRSDGNMDDFKGHIVFRVIVQIVTVVIHILMFTEGDVKEIVFTAGQIEDGAFLAFMDLEDFAFLGGLRVWIWLVAAGLLLAWVIYGTIFTACCGCNCVPWCESAGDSHGGGGDCSDVHCGPTDAD